jgi:simple sugar transport system ATP-binding protein
MIDRFSIAARGPDAITADLSGGTLQRALVARSLQILSRSSGGLLVAVNPTQGLDIGATRFVREHLRDLTRNNGAVLLISEDLDELFELSDRIAVLFSNVVKAEYPRERFDRYAIGANMVGAQRD